MRNDTYYLNNSGSRWIHMINGKREKVSLTTKSGKRVERTANYYSSFGNFATVNISYKGKKINVFTDTLLED